MTPETEKKVVKTVSALQSLILAAAPDCPPSLAHNISETLDSAGFKKLEDFEPYHNKAAQKMQNAILAAARAAAARIIQSDFETAMSDAAAAFKTRYESELEARAETLRSQGINVNKNLIHLQQIVSLSLCHAAQLDASVLLSAAAKMQEENRKSKK